MKGSLVRQAEEVQPDPGIRTITAKELMRLDLPPQPEVVPGTVQVGLNVLASKPKIGKSWMVLQWCLAVATGGKALGHISVEKGKAAYLGLEDGQRRLQSRLDIMLRGQEAPDGLLLATAGDLDRIDQGGLEQLETFIARELPRIVGIDTLGRFKAPGSSSRNTYDEDYALGGQLQNLGLKYECGIVAVHHLRKAPGDDPIDTVSGSTGLTGAADSILVLRRPRGEADAVMTVFGREIEERDMALRFHPHDGTWELLGSAAEYAVTKERRAIIEYLQGLDGEAAGPKEIAEATGGKVGSVRHLLRKLVDAGVITNPGYGEYAAGSVNGVGRAVHTPIHTSGRYPQDPIHTVHTPPGNPSGTQNAKAQSVNGSNSDRSHLDDEEATVNGVNARGQAND